MKDRDTWLDEIPLTSDQVLVSDIYVVRNGPLRTSSEVDIDFTFTPMSSTKNKNIKVIAKQDGEWTEVEAVTEVIKTLFLHLFIFFVWLFVVFHPNREFFLQMETSAMPTKVEPCNFSFL